MKIETGTWMKWILPAVALVALSVGTPKQASAQGFADLTGSFVLDGPIPKPKVLIKKGDPKAKDPAICATADLFSDSLNVDAQTKGISDIFIYLRKPPASIHPDLKESKKKTIDFNQEGCRFFPHSLFVRTDQKVRVLSKDACSHNTHTFPIRNQAVNFLLRPKEDVGVPIANPLSEFLPIQVKCDIHPWMLAHWLILDHPYAAVTDAKGKFTIPKLPAGEHEFRVWHERVGYIDKKFTVTIEAGKPNNQKPIKVPIAKFGD